jgi:heme exporter protein D
VTSVEEKMPDEEAYIPLDTPVHLSAMPFGCGRTASAIFLTLLGLILSILSKRSLQYVKMEEPVNISDDFSGITDFGMVRLQLCYKDEFMASREIDGDSSVAVPYLNGTDDVDESAHHEPCFILRLSASIIDDPRWEFSRVSMSIAIALGAFFCIMMILTVRWESINMKPIGAGLIVTYLFQSFSFFFYDTNLCRQHACKLGFGTYLSMLASFCWFGAAMIAIIMDVHHTKKMRRLARREQRRRRRLERRMNRKSTTATGHTESTCDSNNAPPPAVIMEKHPDEGILWKV